MADDNQTPNEESESPDVQVTETSNRFDINTVIEQALSVITDPFGFYRTMPSSGGYTNPIIFVVVLAFTTAAIGFLLSFIGLAKFNAVVGGAVTFAALFLIPIFAVIGSFIGAAVLFVVWKLMGSEKNFEVAYRCVAYSISIAPVIAIISFVPYLAGIVKSLWGLFLLYIASIEVHNIKQQTAKMTFGIIAAISVIWGISAEHTARKYLHWAENFKDGLEQQYKRGSIGDAVKELENIGEMTPEEAGKTMGELFKGMEEFSKGLEEGAKELEQQEEKSGG